MGRHLASNIFLLVGRLFYVSNEKDRELQFPY